MTSASKVNYWNCFIVTKTKLVYLVNEKHITSRIVTPIETLLLVHHDISY